jgi:hypothetical protein
MEKPLQIQGRDDRDGRDDEMQRLANRCLRYYCPTILKNLSKEEQDSKKGW